MNKVLPVSELQGFAATQLARLVALPASSIRTTKRLMKGQTSDVEARIAEEVDYFSAMLQSPEAKEAFSAFLQKRKPDFSRFE